MTPAQEKAVRKEFAAMSDWDVVWLTIDADVETDLCHLALEEHYRRDEERGYPLGWPSREAWEESERKREEHAAELERFMEGNKKP